LLQLYQTDRQGQLTHHLCRDDLHLRHPTELGLDHHRGAVDPVM